MMDWLNYEELRERLNHFMPGMGDLFLEIFTALIQGEAEMVFREFPEMFREIVKQSASDLTGACILLLVLGILSALLSHLSQIFKDRNAGEVAFYFCYLTGAGILIALYYSMVETAVAMIQVIVGFTETLIPIFYLTVAMTRQIQTAAGFYHLNLLLLYAVEVIIPEVIVPVVSGYIYISIISGMSGDDLFAGFLGLIKKCVSLLQKSAMLVIGGVGMMKKMLHGATDGMNLAVWQKTIGAIPVLGDLSDGMTGILLGTAVLIKNGLGISFLIVILFLVATPVIKLFVIAVALQMVAASVSAFGEKRFVKLVERASDACYMILKSCACCVLILLVIIALVCVAI